ncbi:uncharacterized protein LODBEIA_P15420 [Lodderomyces beijingensis]|uniref:Protein kinase domain-containing protein n=1 Tax=Lodderomyces beijingensis TaxID=1775926 RepID=A0ABP0ZGM9_9ASCO
MDSMASESTSTPVSRSRMKLLPTEPDLIAHSKPAVGTSAFSTTPPMPAYVGREFSGQQPSSNAHILEAKTLRRKNFKKLSLDASPVKSEVPVFDDFDQIRQSQSLRSSRQRPAPMLNLANTSPFTSTSTGIIPPESRKLSPGEIVSQTLNRPLSAKEAASGTTAMGLFDINGSNRDVDPESRASAALIMNQISNLDLNSRHLKKNGGNVSATSTTTTSSTRGNRKRQTIISSISPNASKSASPLEPKPQISLDKLSGSQSPLATTTTGGLKLRNSDLITLKQLGSGNSGTVSKVLHLPSQKTMAKKIIHFDSKSVVQTQIIRELRILHECSSPYIIEFYGAFVPSPNTVVICMEYCNCGSLDKIIPLCEHQQFPLFVLKKLSYAILSGLCYLYTTHKIIHRDIKPNNVLMTHKGEFKLCDFGVSRELTNSLAMADTFVGTSMYMSPERIQGLNYGIKSDVWSMGLLLIELASGMPVWQDDDDEDDEYDELSGARRSASSNEGPEGILDLLQRIVNEQAPSLKNKINPVSRKPYDSQLADFIDSCLVKNDVERKSPYQLLDDQTGFLCGVADEKYDAEHKLWAKRIRKLNKEKYETET